MKNLTLVYIFCVVGIFSFKANALQLVTAKEGALPANVSNHLTRGISRGPLITLDSPGKDEEVKSPFSFSMHFEPRGGNQIIPSSLTMKYLKNPEIDLTPRVKAAMTPNGLSIPKTEMPPGVHPIQVLIRDSEGHETTSIFTITVSK